MSRAITDWRLSLCSSKVFKLDKGKGQHEVGSHQNPKRVLWGAPEHQKPIWVSSSSQRETFCAHIVKGFCTYVQFQARIQVQLSLEREKIISEEVLSILARKISYIMYWNLSPKPFSSPFWSWLSVGHWHIFSIFSPSVDYVVLNLQRLVKVSMFSPA